MEKSGKKKIVVKILILLLFLIIVIQFIRPEKNYHPVISANEISSNYAVPDSIRNILKTSCYDCHSNNTYYPWYNNIQPLAWWLNRHIEEGKRELNFDEFTTYRIRKQYIKLDQIIKLIKKDEMPLNSYTLIHKNAVLNEQQKGMIINWASQIRDLIKNSYPPDSLVKKQ
ncbi:heme-binding domain-containing protein [soil metagenome]